MKRIMCVWFPNWPIQRLVNEQTELKKRPIVLYESGGRSGLRVGFASTAARQQGIEVGASVADALARLGRRLHLAAYDPSLCHRSLVELAQRCEQFSPIVGVEEAAATKANSAQRPESILLDITGIGQLFKGEAELAHLVNKTFRQWGLWSKVAIAPTIGAAWAFAHCLSTDRQPFCAGNAFTEPLEPLPMSALRLSDSTLESLSDLGLHVIGDLMKLPRDSLASRFAPELLYRFNQTLGELKENIQPIRQPETFQATWDLFYPTNKKAAVHSIVSQLADRLAISLQSANRGALKVVLSMTCEPNYGSKENAKAAFEIGLYRPCSSAKHLYELLQLKLERARLPSAVISVKLHATHTSLVAPEQKELFADESRGHEDEFALLVDQLTSRLGEQAVVRPLLYANAQPERAFRERPLVHSRLGKKNAGKNRRGASHRNATSSTTRQQKPTSNTFATQFEPLERPTLLFRRPIPIEVTAVFPAARPRRFVWSGNSYEVVREIGPERIETSWWGQQGVRRDYYRVVTKCGGWFWIFKQLQSGKWFLHGEFA